MIFVRPYSPMQRHGVERLGVRREIDANFRTRQTGAINQRCMVNASQNMSVSRPPDVPKAPSVVQPSRRFASTGAEEQRAPGRRNRRRTPRVSSSSFACAREWPPSRCDPPLPAPYFLCAFRQCFAQGFVRGQPEIIVARKADDLASVHRHVRGAALVGDSATTT